MLLDSSIHILHSCTMILGERSGNSSLSIHNNRCWFHFDIDLYFFRSSFFLCSFFPNWFCFFLFNATRIAWHGKRPLLYYIFEQDIEEALSSNLFSNFDIRRRLSNRVTIGYIRIRFTIRLISIIHLWKNIQGKILSRD